MSKFTQDPLIVEAQLAARDKEIDRLTAERNNWKKRQAEISSHCDWKSKRIAELESENSEYLTCCNRNAIDLRKQEQRIAELEADCDHHKKCYFAAMDEQDKLEATNERLRAALTPFAAFKDALKEWRFGPTAHLLQPAWPEHKPVLRWREKLPPPGMARIGELKMEIRILEVWPQDFARAVEALKESDDD